MRREKIQSNGIPISFIITLCGALRQGASFDFAQGALASLREPIPLQKHRKRQDPKRLIQCQSLANK